MKQDMNMDLGIESFLEPDSDFIEELCEHLEGEGIHLTSELLVQILSKYEDHKFSFFKELIEQLVGADNMALPTDGDQLSFKWLWMGNVIENKKIKIRIT